MTSLLLLLQLWPFPVQTDALLEHRHPGTPQDGYSFCLLQYKSDRVEMMGNGWSTDYPNGGLNLVTRLHEITMTRINETHKQWVVQVGSPHLFLCPLVIASDVGTMFLDEQEAENLKQYLRKGGLLWVDDFWGTAAWDQWLREVNKFIPEGWRVLTPKDDHPIYRMHYQSRGFQVPNVGFYLGGGKTAERGEESPETAPSALVDPKGRIGVLMTHNTDIVDTWEQEKNPVFFDAFAADGYAFGTNVVLYAMGY